MLKTTLATSQTNKNLEQDGYKIQIEDHGEKESTQKNCKG